MATRMQHADVPDPQADAALIAAHTEIHGEIHNDCHCVDGPSSPSLSHPSAITQRTLSPVAAHRFPSNQLAPQAIGIGRIDRPSSPPPPSPDLGLGLLSDSPPNETNSEAARPAAPAHNSSSSRSSTFPDPSSSASSVPILVPVKAVNSNSNSSNSSIINSNHSGESASNIAPPGPARAAPSHSSPLRLPSLPSLPHSRPDPTASSTLTLPLAQQLQQQQQQLQLQLQKQLHLAMHHSDLKGTRSIIPNSPHGESSVDPPSHPHSLAYSYSKKTSDSPDQPSRAFSSDTYPPAAASQDTASPQPGDCAPRNVHQASNSLDPPRFHPEPASSSTAHQPPQEGSSLPSLFKPSIPPMASQAPGTSFPSVQELSLTLSADIEIHRLWRTITEILSQKFNATRITLCLPQDPTVVAPSIENNLHQSRPWGLKAHWDYKHHFLDENTVTPKDEFAHHHHRLQKNASLSQEHTDPQSLRLSVSSPPLPSSSSSSFSSSSSSSFSRRRAANANNSFTINLNSNNNNNNNNRSDHGYSNNNSVDSSSYINRSRNADIDVAQEDRNYVPIPDSKTEYHEDYWITNPPLDGGYSSSASSVSSYSSTSSSVMEASRATHLRGYSPHSSGTECFANLQSLEYDPEPLLNEHTIDSILKAGKTVVLTREYVARNERRKSARMRSFLSAEDDDDSSCTDTDTVEGHADVEDVEVDGAESRRIAQAIRIGAGFSSEQDAGSDVDSSSSRYDSEGSYFPPVESAASHMHAGSSSFVTAQAKAGYADFVQGLIPTWSQSPAPSPNIIKEDPTVNPFFYQPLTSYPTMDDDTFDPPDPMPDSAEDGHASASDSEPRPHTPLRPLTSNAASKAAPLPPPPSMFANDRSLIHVPLYRSTDHNNQRYLPSDIRHHRPPAMPVGIISFLSDQIPYPPEALDVLMELNPFLANQVTNALRLEDMVARSSRWGEINTSSLGDGSRANESFAQSAKRKMWDKSDVGTSNLDHLRARATQASKDRSASRADQPSRRYRETSGNDFMTTSRERQYVDESGLRSENTGLHYQGSSKATQARSAGSGNTTLNESSFSSFARRSPEPERFERPLSGKQPETCYNLDSTTDEIHRSLNLLNLDVTGSATCPLAPLTKKMLGRQHHNSRNAQSHHTEDAFLSSWTSDRRRTESSPNLLDTDDIDGSDGMWQTLRKEETDPRPSSLPNSRFGDNEFDVPGDESPHFGSIHSVSPSNAAKRHFFSTSKRSGLRRRRKSVKDPTKSQQTPPSLTESPVPNSPYTFSISGFSHRSGVSSGAASYSAPPFSPDHSPTASPTVQQAGMFVHAISSMDTGSSLDDGTYLKPRPFDHGHSQGQGHGREGGEKKRVPFSRHGSGWSFNSDDTSLASPSLQYEKHHIGRKHKRKHHAFPSERSGLSPFPRTRLLRLIVDAIPHHVFTLSPQSGCLTWLNQRSLQYTGQPLTQLVHTSWTSLLHEDDRETFLPLFKECFDRGEMFNAQYRVRRFDGQFRWFLGRLLPVRDCGSKIVHWFGTNTDIHDQKLAELQLNRQVELELNEKKYRLLAEAIPQIVFTAAPQIGLTFANAKWYTYSGQVFEQACGLGFLDHVHPEDRSKCFIPANISEGNGSPPAMSASESAFQYSTSPGSTYGQGPGEDSYQAEMRLLRKDGKYRWFLVKCISVEVVEQGRKWFGTCTDINDQKLLEHKLKEAHDAAQKSTESKTRFLSNMSHEIRTPLVGITGMINFLITTDLTSEQLDYVHTVQQSADALLLVINDILDLSKVEAGMMKLEMEPFSVHNMIEGANELLSTLAIQKGLELGFLVEDDVPEVVVGDRVRLRQVLINIIGNAIKFTTHGEVFSRCSLVPAKPNAEPETLTIKFEISDTGKGFDETERAVMFKPFSQVDTSSTRKHGGTGLGLVLSKEFVELHGGKIQCESVKGEGSKFSFTFVGRVPPSNATAQATTPIATEKLSMDNLLHTNAIGTVASTTAVAPKSAGSKDTKGLEPLLLRHITGLKLVPGEMCYAEPDFEDTRKTATKALEVATQKIARGEFVTSDTTLEPSSAEDEAKEGTASETATKADLLAAELATAMTRTESILDERRYLKVGQLTSSNPPMGEPAGVAIIAANLPNPAVEMKLTIPAKVLESKALAAENKKAAAAAATATVGLIPSTRPELPPSDSSSWSASSTLTDSSVDSKQPAPTTISSAGSSGSEGTASTGKPIPSQPCILVIADFMHARETILHLINQLIPKESNPLLDVAKDMREGVDFLVGARKQATLTAKYNYVVINLPSYMSVMDIFSVLQRDGVLVESNVMTCVITTPIQRAALMEAVKAEKASMEVVKTEMDNSPTRVIPDKVEWVFKPLTKAKLYVAFADIVAHHSGIGNQNGSGAEGQDGSGEIAKINVKRRTAQQVVMGQKEIFSQMHDAMEGKNIRILLAEDDLTNQKVIRRYFQKVGAELVIANDGSECLEKFKSHPKNHFSLVLCDLFMPGMDGYAATRAIRSWEDENLQEGEKRIPIVALSANVMANVAEQCLSSGFTSYLSKPVDFKRLSETLRKLVL